MISFVQNAHNQNGSNVGTSANVTLTNNCTAGNHLLIGLIIGTTIPGTINMSGNGNTYTSAIASHTNVTAQIFYATGISAGATTISASWTNGGAAVMLAYEYKGVLALSLDKTAVGSSSANPAVSAATATTTSFNELVFSVIGGGAAVTYAAGTNFGNYIQDQEGIFLTGGAEDRVVTTKAAYTGSFVNAGSQGSDVAIATFATSGDVHSYGFNTNNLRPHPFSPGLAR